MYQTMLGPFSVLRRIDTDFVNISPILAFSGANTSLVQHTIPNAVVISQGSPTVSGTWVPLSAAQAYARPGGPLDVFLSDALFERFPPALQDFHRSSSAGRRLNQFGPHFASTVQAMQIEGQAEMLLGGGREAKRSSPVVVDEQRQSRNAALPRDLDAVHEPPPLSATEQEMFQALCDNPEWDKENSVPVGNEEKMGFMEPSSTPASPPPLEHSQDRTSDRPLRRSKRVADAIAAQTRTRSRRRVASH